MLNSDKILFAGEKTVRAVNEAIIDVSIDQLIREDLTIEEKQEIAAKAKEVAADNANWEEVNSEWWYKYGKNEGEVIGLCKAAGIMLVGFTIGTLLRKR